MNPAIYVRISEGEALPIISTHAPFRAVVVAEYACESKWQDIVSEWLVESGCLYTMPWGPDCSAWDDSVDFANIRRFSPAEIPDRSFVMTTWHENETLDELFWFARNCANHPDVEFKLTLIIHIATNDDRIMMLERFALADHLTDDSDSGDET